MALQKYEKSASIYKQLRKNFANFVVMARHNEIGEWGEKMARDYLVSKGYAVMDKNSRVGCGEIDIVAVKGTRIVFVEVKTRSSDFADPLDAVDEKKMKRLVRAADAFIRSNKIMHDPQFDIIAVVGVPEGECRIEHYEDAFWAPLSGAR